MSNTAHGTSTTAISGTPSHAAQPLPVIALGLSLGLFLAISFVLCVVAELLFPGHGINSAWLRLLPGFTWLSWGSFLLGLVETFACGWYVALVFGPLYNFFARRRG